MLPTSYIVFCCISFFRNVCQMNILDLYRPPHSLELSKTYWVSSVPYTSTNHLASESGVFCSISFVSSPMLVYVEDFCIHALHSCFSLRRDSGSYWKRLHLFASVAHMCVHLTCPSCHYYQTRTRPISDISVRNGNSRAARD